VNEGYRLRGAPERLESILEGFPLGFQSRFGLAPIARAVPSPKEGIKVVVNHHDANDIAVRIVASHERLTAFLTGAFDQAKRGHDSP
jgi:hypothetical protein